MRFLHKRLVFKFLQRPNSTGGKRRICRCGSGCLFITSSAVGEGLPAQPAPERHVVPFHCSSPFCFLFLHGWPESNRLACRWGIRTAGNFLTTPAYQNPPRKRGGAAGRPVAVGSAAFCLGNWDRAFLRSRCDVPFSLCRTAMRARFRKYGQVGFSPPYTEG